MNAINDLQTPEERLRRTESQLELANRRLMSDSMPVGFLVLVVFAIGWMIGFLAGVQYAERNFSSQNHSGKPLSTLSSTLR